VSATVAFSAAPPICSAPALTKNFGVRGATGAAHGLYFKDDNPQLGDNSRQA